MLERKRNNLQFATKCCWSTLRHSFFSLTHSFTRSLTSTTTRQQQAAAAHTLTHESSGDAHSVWRTGQFVWSAVVWQRRPLPPPRSRPDSSAHSASFYVLRVESLYGNCCKSHWAGAALVSPSNSDEGVSATVLKKSACTCVVVAWLKWSICDMFSIYKQKTKKKK